MALAIDRRLTARTVAEESAIEAHVQGHEELTFIRRVKGDASRVIRLIEGGLLIEAESVAGGLQHAATRRERQVLVDEDGAA